MTKVLLTRTLEDNRRWAEALFSSGIESQSMPLIKTHSLAKGKERLKTITKVKMPVLAFTSRKAAHIFFHVHNGQKFLKNSEADWCFLGNGTASAVGNIDLECVHVSDGQGGKSFARWILELFDLSKRTVLHFCSIQPRKEFARTIRESGGSVQEIPLYETRKEVYSPREIATAFENNDFILLASPSAVRSIESSLGEEHSREAFRKYHDKVVAIGDTTKATILQKFEVEVEALKNPTVSALTKFIQASSNE